METKRQLLNKEIDRLMKIKPPDYKGLQMQYLELALLAAESGQNPYEFKVQANRMELLHFKISGVISRVSILIDEQAACDECRKWSGKIFTIEEALSTNPLPNKECSKDFFDGIQWCRCCYLPIVDP